MHVSTTRHCCWPVARTRVVVTWYDMAVDMAVAVVAYGTQDALDRLLYDELKREQTDAQQKARIKKMLQAKARDYPVAGLSTGHIAAYFGHGPVIRRLVETGYDIEARDSKGLTMLHRAAAHGHVVAVHTLLELGADPAPKGKASP